MTSTDLCKRSHITFYFDNVRIREFHGKNIGQRINPNRADTLEDNTLLLNKLRFEIHKALDANNYPCKPDGSIGVETTQSEDVPTAIKLLFEVVKRKLRSDALHHQ